jgi:hypothetical protein
MIPVSVGCPYQAGFGSSPLRQVSAARKRAKADWNAWKSDSLSSAHIADGVAACGAVTSDAMSRTTCSTTRGRSAGGSVRICSKMLCAVKAIGRPLDLNQGSHLRGGGLSRNRRDLAGPYLITTANRFCRPRGADFIVRKWVQAFHKAISQQGARISGQDQHLLGQLLHRNGHTVRVRQSSQSGNLGA